MKTFLIILVWLISAVLSLLFFVGAKRQNGWEDEEANDEYKTR